MTKLFAFVAIFSAFSLSAWAGGSRRPANDFAGSYSLVRGQSIEDSDGAVWNCPSSMVAVLNESTNRNDKVDGRTLSFRSSESASAEILPSFEGINLGEYRSGFNFWSSYTDKSSLVYEEGREHYNPGRPGRPPYDPVTPPRTDRFYTYRYKLKFEKDSTVTLSTTASRGECVFNKLN